MSDDIVFEGLGGAADSVAAFVGKTIAGLMLGEDNALHFVFDDGSKVKLYEVRYGDEQERCYMHTDNNLAEFVGARVRGCKSRELLSVEMVLFLDVETDRGVFTVASRKEHNGYYGGVWSAAVE